MFKYVFIILLSFGLVACDRKSNEPETPNQLIYVWLFDDGIESPNFLAVIDAVSPVNAYGTKL